MRTTRRRNRINSIVSWCSSNEGGTCEWTHIQSVTLRARERERRGKNEQQLCLIEPIHFLVGEEKEMHNDRSIDLFRQKLIGIFSTFTKKMTSLTRHNDFRYVCCLEGTNHSFIRFFLSVLLPESTVKEKKRERERKKRFIHSPTNGLSGFDSIPTLDEFFSALQSVRINRSGKSKITRSMWTNSLCFFRICRNRPKRSSLTLFGSSCFLCSSTFIALHISAKVTKWIGKRKTCSLNISTQQGRVFSCGCCSVFLGLIMPCGDCCCCCSVSRSIKTKKMNTDGFFFLFVLSKKEDDVRFLSFSLSLVVLKYIYVVNALTHRRKRGYQHNYSYDYASSPRAVPFLLYIMIICLLNTLRSLSLSHSYDTIFHPNDRKIYCVLFLFKSGQIDTILSIRSFII